MRQAAAAGLEALGPQARAAVDPLLDAVAAVDLTLLPVASRCGDALGVILQSENAPPPRLAELAASDNAAVRLAAARTLAVRNDRDRRGLLVLETAFAATDLLDPTLAMPVPPFGEQPSPAWLGRMLIAREGQLTDRLQAARTLATLGADALPALPALLQAVADDELLVTHHAVLAIQAIGPQAVPAVAAAITSTDDRAVRRRLEAVLWNLGPDGQKQLKESLTPGYLEAVWWAAARSTWDYDESEKLQAAVRAALVRVGRIAEVPRRPATVPPRTTFRFEPRSVAWATTLIADDETPAMVWRSALSVLFRAPYEQIEPALAALLARIVREQHRAIITSLANLIQRVGPAAIAPVKAAIPQAQSDFARRELLRALSNLGPDGRREFQTLMQLNPEYSALFERSDNEPGPARPVRVARTLSELEAKAIAEAARTDRPLTNGDFHSGMQGWNIEGGAGAFRTFPIRGKHAITTFGAGHGSNTGRLFQCFKVPQDAKLLTFKIHGGGNANKVYVALWRKNYRHARIAGRNHNDPIDMHVDLTLLRGEVVTLEIVDDSTQGWGFIGAEDFQIVSEK